VKLRDKRRVELRVPFKGALGVSVISKIVA
jgi:hypothetical protein